MLIAIYKLLRDGPEFLGLVCSVNLRFHLDVAEMFCDANH